MHAGTVSTSKLHTKMSWGLKPGLSGYQLNTMFTLTAFSRRLYSNQHSSYTVILYLQG